MLVNVIVSGPVGAGKSALVMEIVGALRAIGAALAAGTPVYAIGCDEFSFVNHDKVFPCRDLDDAISQAMDYSVTWLAPSDAPSTTEADR